MKPKNLPKYLSGCRLAVETRHTPTAIYNAVKRSVIQPDAFNDNRPLFLETRLAEITEQLHASR